MLELYLMHFIRIDNKNRVLITLILVHHDNILCIKFESFEKCIALLYNKKNYSLSYSVNELTTDLIGNLFLLFKIHYYSVWFKD